MSKKKSEHVSFPSLHGRSERDIPVPTGAIRTLAKLKEEVRWKGLEVLLEEVC